MKNLLKFELHNAVRQKSIYILPVIMLIFLSLLNNTPEGRLEYYHSIGYGAEDMIVGALSSCFFTYFLAGVIAFVVCRDHERGVMKNIYAKGYTRACVYTAKFIFTMIISTILYVITMGLAAIQAGMVFGWQKTDIAVIMIAQYVAVLAYCAFQNLVCQFIKKTGFAISFLIIVPPVGGLLLDVIDNALGFDFSFGDLWITQTMAYIHGGTVTAKEITLSFILSGVYIVGCYFLGRLIKEK